MSNTLLLLSGGASTRMGQDKASLPIAGTTLLQWQEAHYRQAGFHVVSRLADLFPGFLGPLAGLHAACVHLPEQSQFIAVPVDMPQLSLASIQALITASANSNRPTCFTDCPLPIALTNTPELKNTLARWLADEHGRRSVYALMQELNGSWLNAEEYKADLNNINTPQQWQKFLTGEVRP